MRIKSFVLVLLVFLLCAQMAYAAPKYKVTVEKFDLEVSGHARVTLVKGQELPDYVPKVLVDLLLKLKRIQEVR